MLLNPTISSESLAEYMTSGPVLRMGIIERSKYPSVYAGRFEVGRRRVLAFLCGELDGNEIRYFDGLPEDDADYIRRFLLLGVCLRQPRGFKPVYGLEVNGVTIRDAPTVLLDNAGVTLLDRGPHMGTAGQYAAEVTAMHLARRETYGGADCFALDVLGGKVYRPQRTARWTLDIESACDEIRRSWSTV